MAAMANPETIERVRERRERGRTPKEIARALRLPRAEVTSLIRVVAAAQPPREVALIGCWVNQNWAAGLTVTGHPEWPGAGEVAASGESGLVNVLVARDAGSRVSACGYLVDAWCLGVQNARELGFEPHPDFAGCAGHLGPWDGSSDITFGRDGNPMYIQGPYDDAALIVRTLRRSVGDGNFDFLSQIP